MKVKLLRILSCVFICCVALAQAKASNQPIKENIVEKNIAFVKSDCQNFTLAVSDYTDKPNLVYKLESLIKIKPKRGSKKYILATLYETYIC